MWQFSVARLIVGLSFLIVASVKDLRTRRVENELWIVLGIIGMVILAAELFIVEGADWEIYLFFIPLGIIFAEAFIDRPPIYSEGKLNLRVLGWLLIPIIVYLFLLNDFSESLLFWRLTMIVGVMLFVYLLYFLYIIYGGADAKAIISLAILLPAYPEIPNLTRHAMAPETVEIMEIAFPFTLVILLNACLVFLIFPVINFFINLSKGDVDIPKMFFGYRKKVSELEDSFAWPMEYFEDGKMKAKLMPRSDSEEKIQSLIENDIDEVWSTPKIPFIAIILIGLVISFIIGNPMAYILG